MPDPSSPPSGPRWFWPAILLCALVGIYFWIRQMKESGPSTPPTPTVSPAEQAERDLRRTVSQLVTTAKADEAKGDIDAALDAYKRILEKSPKEPGIAEKVAALSTERSFRAAMADGDRALVAQDWDAARRAYETAASLKSTEDLRTKLQRARYSVAYADGQKAEAAGNLSAAVTSYRAALDFLENEEARVRLKAVEAQLAEQKREARRKEFEVKFAAAEALEKNSKYAEACAAYEGCRASCDEPALLDARITSCKKKRDEIEQLFSSAMLAARKAATEEEWTAAVIAVDRALAYRPDDPEALALKRTATEQAILREMVLIPAGDATLGSDEGERERPVRTVFLGAYYIDRNEVTNAQYQAYVEAARAQAPAHWKNNKPPKGQENYPVIGVSVAEAEAYAKWAGKRLPTADEWEKAARGPTGRRFPWGDEFDPAKCVALGAERGFAMPVGSCKAGASPYGCFDMAGNVLEWTATIVPGSVTDSTGQQRAREFRILKGGSFLYPGDKLRSSNVFVDDPELNFVDVGFRCGRDALPQ